VNDGGKKLSASVQIEMMKLFDSDTDRKRRRA
jgi:hypothetical protein